MSNITEGDLVKIILLENGERVATKSSFLNGDETVLLKRSVSGDLLAHKSRVMEGDTVIITNDSNNNKLAYNSGVGTFYQHYFNYSMCLMRGITETPMVVIFVVASEFPDLLGIYLVATDETFSEVSKIYHIKKIEGVLDTIQLKTFYQGSYPNFEINRKSYLYTEFNGDNTWFDNNLLFYQRLTQYFRVTDAEISANGDVLLQIYIVRDYDTTPGGVHTYDEIVFNIDNIEIVNDFGIIRSGNCTVSLNPSWVNKDLDWIYYSKFEDVAISISTKNAGYGPYRWISLLITIYWYVYKASTGKLLYSKQVHPYEYYYVGGEGGALYIDENGEHSFPGCYNGTISCFVDGTGYDYKINGIRYFGIDCGNYIGSFIEYYGNGNGIVAILGAQRYLGSMMTLQVVYNVSNYIIDDVEISSSNPVWILYGDTQFKRVYEWLQKAKRFVIYNPVDYKFCCLATVGWYAGEYFDAASDYYNRGYEYNRENIQFPSSYSNRENIYLTFSTIPATTEFVLMGIQFEFDAGYVISYEHKMQIDGKWEFPNIYPWAHLPPIY